MNPSLVMQEGPKTRRLLTQAKSTPKAKETKAKVASASPRKKAAAVHVETNGHASPGMLPTCDGNKKFSISASAFLKTTFVATRMVQKMSTTFFLQGKLQGKPKLNMLK